MPHANLTALRDLLQQWSPATGPDGFEGLVAQALERFTGYTFRLARSGYQFGRDAATPNAPFAIAMEAKRYSANVPLQELVGKATLASALLAGGIDLWVLASTVEISEPTERELERILDEKGISLLTLDWTEAGLPPLAILLAAVSEDIVSWAESFLQPPELKILTTGLAQVYADPSFCTHLEEIRGKLSPIHLGLDAFRQKGGEWFESVFGSRRLAQRNFSQYLSPLDAGVPIADRTTLQHAITHAVHTANLDEEGETFVALLGGEGSGKTWAIANWWFACNPRPILMLSAGRIADQLSPGQQAIEMLARLATSQFGSRDDSVFSRWCRRFERWSSGNRSRDRFIVVIDGLNEISGKGWATIIHDLLPVVSNLGGVLITTCREGYWNREIASRLPNDVAALSVHVSDYDDEEFNNIMLKNNVDPASLPPRLREFMRNPRICALALTMLPHLAEVAELSVDRLLLEYWRARLQERGDLVAHNDIDFRDLLIRHAQEYRERPGTDFHRDEWRSRSGASTRGDGREISNDLSDIEEGRFFDSLSNTYQFREEALHFALGLLVVDELRQVIRSDGVDLQEALARIIDPIRGFDALADILGAAIAIATLDADCPDPAIAALASGWFSLQNLRQSPVDLFQPYIGARPEPFLDAFESGNSNRDDRFLMLLIYCASLRSSVAHALDRRLENWLGTWSRTLPGPNERPDQAHQKAQHNKAIDDRLASLNDTEREKFGQICVEFPRSLDLKEAAALSLLGKPQATYAGGVFAFAFAFKIAGHYFWPYDELAWVLRLNRSDPKEMTAAIFEVVAKFTTPDSSPLARETAAFALRLIGSEEAAVEANTLQPQRPPPPEKFGSSDPLDPKADCPQDIDAATARLSAIDPDKLWNHMGTTSEDHELDDHLTRLARFNLDGLKAILNKIAGTVAFRTDLPLRQLAWRLPWLSPILYETTISAVRQRIAEAVDDPSIMPDGDADLIIGMLVECVLPTLDGYGQLDLLQSLPPKAPYYLRYSAVAQPLDGAEGAVRLSRVMDGDPRVIERTLFFLSAAVTEVTNALRVLVVRCLNSNQKRIVAAAAEVAMSVDDSGLDEMILELDVPIADDRNRRDLRIRAAIACAIARRKRIDLIETVPVEHLDWVAARLGAAMGRLMRSIDSIISCLIQPIPFAEPADAIVMLEAGDPFEVPHFYLRDRGEKSADPLKALQLDFSDKTGKRFARRRRLLAKQLQQLLDSLAAADALSLARRPYSGALSQLARHNGKKYAAWLQSILSTRDERSLRQVRNIGFTLARSYARFDPDLSARTIAHLWKVESCITITVGAAKLPSSHLSLFSTPSNREIDPLRDEVIKGALNDSEIEQLVLAAELSGSGEWLSDFVEACLNVEAPADQALAVTIASLRPANDHSDRILDRKWKPGFLNEASKVGRARYQRAKHADEWFRLARAAENDHERWGFIELGIAAADRRHLLSRPHIGCPELRLIGADLAPRLDKAADKATKKLNESLYGLKRPGDMIERVARRALSPKVLKHDF